MIDKNCKGTIFHGNSLHCKGPILAKFWAERMVILRSSAPSVLGAVSTTWESFKFCVIRYPPPPMNRETPFYTISKDKSSSDMRKRFAFVCTTALHIKWLLFMKARKSLRFLLLLFRIKKISIGYFFKKKEKNFKKTLYFVYLDIYSANRWRKWVLFLSKKEFSIM